MISKLDSKGRTWCLYKANYVHPVDSMLIPIRFWAIDYEDAKERIMYIKETLRLEPENEQGNAD